MSRPKIYRIHFRLPKPLIRNARTESIPAREGFSMFMVIEELCPIEQGAGMSGWALSIVSVLLNKKVEFQERSLAIRKPSHVTLKEKVSYIVNYQMFDFSMLMLIGELCPIEQAGEISGRALSNMKTVSCYFK